jgi:Flp pilus assembly pilin Flp
MKILFSIIFWGDDYGSVATEYALLLGGITVVIIAAVALLGLAVQQLFQSPFVQVPN